MRKVLLTAAALAAVYAVSAQRPMGGPGMGGFGGGMMISSPMMGASSTLDLSQVTQTQVTVMAGNLGLDESQKKKIEKIAKKENEAVANIIFSVRSNSRGGGFDGPMGGMGGPGMGGPEMAPMGGGMPEGMPQMPDSLRRRMMGQGRPDSLRRGGFPAGEGALSEDKMRAMRQMADSLRGRMTGQGMPDSLRRGGFPTGEGAMSEDQMGAMRQMASMMRSGRGVNLSSEDTQKQLMKIYDSSEKKIAKILSPDQLAKWQSMASENATERVSRQNQIVDLIQRSQSGMGFPMGGMGFPMGGPMGPF